jgi:hypothetical protein
MQKAAQYRVFAEQCRQLAKTMGEKHKETLLKIAEAWEKCAADAESETGLVRDHC